MGWFWPNDNNQKIDKILELVNTILDYNEVIDEQMGKLMTAQDDVNAAVTAVNDLLTDVQTQVNSVATDVAAIQQQLASGASVDTSALDAAVANIQGVQSSLDQGVAALTSLANPAPAAP